MSEPELKLAIVELEKRVDKLPPDVAEYVRYYMAERAAVDKAAAQAVYLARARGIKL